MHVRAAEADVKEFYVAELPTSTSGEASSASSTSSSAWRRLPPGGGGGVTQLVHAPDGSGVYAFAYENGKAAHLSENASAVECKWANEEGFAILSLFWKPKAK